MHLPACEVKFLRNSTWGLRGIIKLPVIIIAAEPPPQSLTGLGKRNYCTQVSHQWKMKFAALTLRSITWWEERLMRGPNAHHNRIYSAKLYDHALVPAGALLLRWFFLGVHRTWRQELPHVLGVVSLLVGFKDSGTWKGLPTQRTTKRPLSCMHSAVVFHVMS